MTGPKDFARAARAAWTAQARVRLRTLILLRWLAVAGQTAAVLFVQYVLKFDLPLGEALLVIAASAAVNVVLMFTSPTQRLVREWEAALQLSYDLVQLSVLIGLTGGIENPFMLLLIAPVAVSAVLRSTTSLALAGLAFICVGALSTWSAQLPWTPGAEPFHLPPLYAWGLATAVLIGLGFTGVYAWRIANEEERLNAALDAVQTVLAREQKLSALGGLAAAAAHELGTPLATIHLVAKELARETPADSPLYEDLQLLISQSERCRDILRQLSSRGDEGDMVHSRLSLGALLDEAIAPHRGHGVAIMVTVEPMSADAGAAPELTRLPEIIYGLNNLVENAVDFAATEVDVEARWSNDLIEITVSDNGPGFAATSLNRLGEPYFSSRHATSRGGGLGLGFFIAKTLMERTGARVRYFNRNAPETGAVVTAEWPRRMVEAQGPSVVSPATISPPQSREPSLSSPPGRL